MAFVNVNGEVDDAFYRYKMPKLVAKLEGKGNGRKTVIVNMVEIAKALHRPPAYVTKYFGCELGAQVNLDSRFKVNGPHESAKLQELLHGFIKVFILCRGCDNPETNLEVTKRSIHQNCLACGHRTPVPLVHKLTTFILKNPPSADQLSCSSAAASNSKRSKSDKRQDDGKGAGDTNSTDAPLSRKIPGDTNAVSGSSKTVSDTSDIASPDKASDDWGDDDWSVDTSADAVKQRMTQLSSAAASMATTDELELGEDARLERLHDFVSKQMKNGKLNPTNRSAFDEAKRLDILDKGVFIVCEVLLDRSVLEQLKTYSKLLLQFLADNHKAQKHFLGALEKLVGKRIPDLMSRVPHLLKLTYDLDLVEEDVFIDWHAKVSKRYVDRTTAEAVRERAALFIKWLKEAEEDDDDDDEEESEDEVDIVYTHKSQAQVEQEERAKKKAEALAANSGAVEEDDDDLDIDNI